VGCIPSKALLQSSEHFEHAKLHFADHGISTGKVEMDVAKMIARKDTVVKQNNDGILYLFKKNKVTFFHGRGSFVKAVEGGYEIKVAGKEEKSSPASRSWWPPAPTPVPCPAWPSTKRTSCPTTALCAWASPKKLGVIGAGVIGLEMGSVWRRLGTEVTVLEGMTSSCPWWTSRSPRKPRRLSTSKV
jgi:dihydrolipoamide dehydrogenase